MRSVALKQQEQGNHLFVFKIPTKSFEVILFTKRGSASLFPEKKNCQRAKAMRSSPETCIDAQRFGPNLVRKMI
jgi:hypothetical protein